MSSAFVVPRSHLGDYLVVEGMMYIRYLQGPEDGTLKEILNELIL